MGDTRATSARRPAEGLLAVARLRVECLRTGVRELSATPGPLGAGVAGRRALVARVSPIVLPASAQVRLRRLHRDARYKEDARQLLVPLAAGADPAEALADLLRSLLPPAPDEPDRTPAVSTGSMPNS